MPRTGAWHKQRPRHFAQGPSRFWQVYRSTPLGVTSSCILGQSVTFRPIRRTFFRIFSRRPSSPVSSFRFSALRVFPSAKAPAFRSGPLRFRQVYRSTPLGVTSSCILGQSVTNSPIFEKVFSFIGISSPVFLPQGQKPQHLCISDDGVLCRQIPGCSLFCCRKHGCRVSFKFKARAVSMAAAPVLAADFHRIDVFPVGAHRHGAVAG